MQGTTTERADEATVRVEVLVETGTYEGGWKFATRAEVDPDDDECQDPISVGRRLWDEAYTNAQGCRRRLTFTTFGPNYPDGHSIRMEHRP